MKNFKEGDVLPVYNNHMTCKIFWGLAKLITYKGKGLEFIDDNDQLYGSEKWVVEFTDTNKHFKKGTTKLATFRYILAESEEDSYNEFTSEDKDYLQDNFLTVDGIEIY